MLWTAVLLALLAAASAGDCDSDGDCELQAMLQVSRRAGDASPTAAPVPPPPPATEWPVALVWGGSADKFMVKTQGGKVPTGVAQATALEILKKQTLLDSTVPNCTCGKLSGQPAGPACGWQWFKDDVMLPCPQETALSIVHYGPTATVLKLAYELRSEALMNTDLAKFVRDQQGLGPAERTNMLDAMRSEGITSRAGLRSANIAHLVKAAGVSGPAGPVMQQNLQTEAAAQNAAAQGSPTPSPFPAVKIGDVMTAASNARSSAAGLSKALEEAVNTAVKVGTAGLTAEASAKLQSVQAQLGALKNLAGDMSEEAKAASNAVKAYDGSTGATSVIGSSKTHKWNVRKMIERNGMLRGASVMLDLESTAQAQVVQLKEHMSVLDETALEALVALQPDIQTAEVSITSTSASSLSQANRAIESSGYSSFNARKESIGAGLAITGGPVTLALGFSKNKFSSQGLAEVQSASETEQLSKMTNSLLKSRYFFEPREEIRIPEDALEATPSFLDALKPVEDKPWGQRADAIQRVFRRFGTHVCPHTLLGGWWRIDAKYTSALSQRGVDMARATSLAMEEAASKSFAMGLQVAGAGAEAGGGIDFSTGSGEADKAKENNTSGARLLGRYATKDGVLDVQQEWKGGMSGGTLTSWRASLDRKTNAYWKVIDRFASDCIGIWMFAPSTIMQEMCETWNSAFMDCLGDQLTVDEKISLLKGCDTGDMRKAREDVVILLSHKAVAKQKAAEADCKNTPGFWWGIDGLGTAPKCNTNVCTCGPVMGAFGVDCPVHGAEKCKVEQLALCTTLTCDSKSIHVPGAGSTHCVGTVCGQSDVAACCRGAGIGRSFDIKIRFSSTALMGLEGNSMLRVQLKDKSGATTDFIDWGQYASSGQEAMHPITSNIGDIEPVEICIENHFLKHPLDYFSVDWLQIKNQDAPDSTNFWVEINSWGGALHTSGPKTKCKAVDMSTSR